MSHRRSSDLIFRHITGGMRLCMVLQEPECGSKTLLQDMQEAYEKGLVSEEAITEAVERLMEVRIRLGMMKDYPSPYEDITYDKVECPEHVKLSVEAARRSLVLLKNENAFLPLDKNKIQTVAVSSRMQEVQNLPEVTWLRWWSAERVRRHRLSISVQKYQETILNIVSYML